MGEFTALLDQLIEARRVSVHYLASQVPCSAGHISNLRNGKKQPSPTIAERLDHLLCADGELSRAARGQPDSEPPDTRALLNELTVQAIDLGRWVETSSIGDGTIGQLDDLLDRIARDYLRTPPEPLIARAADIARQVGRFLRERQRLRHARDLYVLGSKAYAFLSWAAGDLGQIAAAAAHGRTALILAGECGHPGARALALCALSKTAFWDGRPRRAADFAREGYACAPRNSTRALLACQEADASDVPAALAALARARQAQEEITRDGDLPGVFACGQVRIANYSIPVHLRDGDPATAIEMADHAACYAGEDVGYGTWGQIQIGAAYAHLARRELDEAAARLDNVLALPPGQRLATLTARLNEMTPALRRGPYGGDRQAAGLADHIRVFCDEATTVRALPAGKGGDR